jgi:hypothetical protein
MMISNERLEEFQDAYRDDFGADISAEEAREILSRLVTLYDRLRRPFPDEKEDGKEFTQPADTL